MLGIRRAPSVDWRAFLTILPLVAAVTNSTDRSASLRYEIEKARTRYMCAHVCTCVRGARAHMHVHASAFTRAQMHTRTARLRACASVCMRVGASHGLRAFRFARLEPFLVKALHFDCMPSIEKCVPYS